MSDLNEMLRVEARKLRREIETAREFLNHAAQIEIDDSSATGLQASLDFQYRVASAEFLLQANEQPERIVGWLMAKAIVELPVHFEQIAVNTLIGTVNLNHDQFVRALAVESRTVALFTFGYEEVCGEPVTCGDMVGVIRSAGLPVWEELSA